MPQITLKALRANANMTIEQWAEALGVSKGTVCNWENNFTQPPFVQLKKMSELSGVPIDCIFLPEKSK